MTTKQYYTFGDGCKSPCGSAFRQFLTFIVCGAGGTTNGAKLAKLGVQWGFDWDPEAGETWKKNFPASTFYNLAADRFVAIPTDENNFLIVDILHLSPPCQVFSPIKTRVGCHDETNYASLFAVREVIEKVRPRIVTLEQTFGLCHQKHKGAFNALIRMFVDHGFSVSWGVKKFQDWGLAQARRRLIIIAAW